MSIKKKTLPKMQFVCSDITIRPSMMHVEITKESVTASNGHALVSHHAEEVFSIDFIQDMPELFFLHKNVWRELCKPHIHIEYDKERKIIIQYMDGYTNYYSPVIDPVWMYPAWKSVIDSKNESVDAIGLNFEVVNQFYKAFKLPGMLRSKLTFRGVNAGILVTDEHYRSKGLIMPCSL